MFLFVFFIKYTSKLITKFYEVDTKGDVIFEKKISPKIWIIVGCCWLQHRNIQTTESIESVKDFFKYCFELENARGCFTPTTNAAQTQTNYTSENTSHIRESGIQRTLSLMHTYRKKRVSDQQVRSLSHCTSCEHNSVLKTAETGQRGDRVETINCRIQKKIHTTNQCTIVNENQCRGLFDSQRT